MLVSVMAGLFDIPSYSVGIPSFHVLKAVCFPDGELQTLHIVSVSVCATVCTWLQEDSVRKLVLSFHTTREGLLFLLRYGLQPSWPVSGWDSLVSTLLLMVGAVGFQLHAVSLGFLMWISGIELSSPYTAEPSVWVQLQFL